MDIKGFIKSIEGMSENTRHAYEETLWQLHSKIKGREPTTEEIYTFLNTYSASSLHRHKAAIKAYLEYLRPGEPWPFTRRQFVGRRHHIPRYVSPEVVVELIAAAQNEDDRMFVKTLFNLGCRIQELLDIYEKDLSPSGARVLTKGGRYRLKPTTKEFTRELEAYAKTKTGRLFPKPYSYYYQKLKELGKKVGHPEVSPHMLRHARAVDLLRKGLPLPFVQQFLGHANINTTAVYLEITGGELGIELEKVEANASKVSGSLKS